MAKKIPTSMFQRGSKILGIASKVAINEMTSKLKYWENEKEKVEQKIKMAKDAVKTLSELKGASMKLGQILSLDFGDIIPPEVADVLSTLHNKATFLPFNEVYKTLERELGEKMKDFIDIHEEPIAAASIGQVHLARLKNKNVVIKIQYPGIEKSISSDLKLLQMIIKNSILLQGKDVDFSGLFDEIESVLKLEANYLHEIEMQNKYKNLYLNSPFIIPDVYKEYSTKSVLTQEYLDGESFKSWLSKNPSIELKNKIADQLMKLYISEFFYNHIVQTDPNPGNFLISPKNELILLDFGSVREFTPEFVENYKKIIKSAYNNDFDQLISLSVELKFIDQRESKEVLELYAKMLFKTTEPFKSTEGFYFSDKEFYTELRDISWELTKKCTYSPPPKELVFLHRKLFGVFILIKNMNISVNLNSYWKYIENKEEITY